MNDRQRRFLEHLADPIRRLIDTVAGGADRAEHTIGHRRIGRRVVRLFLQADAVQRVDDPGPLATHSTRARPTSYQAPGAATVVPVVAKRPRRASRHRRRW